MAMSSVWLFCGSSLFSLVVVLFSLKLHIKSTETFNLFKMISTQKQPYRTSYHFQPPKNWMNDPNGPMIYKGIYHLFYQYNPYGAIWGSNITWAHSTSTDLINWIPHDLAIYASQAADINGCWSGSATILPTGKPVILYTGINAQNQEVQNLVEPKNLLDPFLTEWVKSPKNPLIALTTMSKIDARSFRDPTTAWIGPDRQWRVIIGSQRNRRGLAILYRSNDFLTWTEVQHPLHFSNDSTGMWECPDFFPVFTDSSIGVETSAIGPKIKRVLKVSFFDTKHDSYTIGTYNHSKDIFFPDEGLVNNAWGLRYDYGKYYASKTFFDSAKNRRILWAWVNESSTEEDDIKKGWSGIQAIPRTLWLNKSGKQLMQWPIVEIKQLRTNRVDSSSTVLKGGSELEISSVTAAQADVEVSFEISEFKNAEVIEPSWSNPQVLCSQKGATVKGELGPFGLLVLASKDMQEYTAVFFRIFSDHDKYVVLMCSDQSRSSLNKDNDQTTYGAFLDVDPVREKLSLRTLIDHSIVESFGGEGKSCITARVYPTLAIGDGAHLYAFNYGTENVGISRLSAWSMKTAQIN